MSQCGAHAPRELGRGRPLESDGGSMNAEPVADAIDAADGTAASMLIGGRAVPEVIPGVIPGVRVTGTSMMAGFTPTLSASRPLSTQRSL